MVRFGQTKCKWSGIVKMVEVIRYNKKKWGLSHMIKSMNVIRFIENGAGGQKIVHFLRYGQNCYGVKSILPTDPLCHNVTNQRCNVTNQRKQFNISTKPTPLLPTPWHSWSCPGCPIPASSSQPSLSSHTAEICKLLSLSPSFLLFSRTERKVPSLLRCGSSTSSYSCCSQSPVTARVSSW